MKKNLLTTIISVALLILALIGTLFLSEDIGSRIATIVTVITAIIGAIALFIQFQKDKAINKANFLSDYSKSFYNDFKLKEFYLGLDNCVRNKKYKIDCEKFKIEIVTYLEWVESIALLINKKIISFEDIDNVFAYRYFLIVNNKQIQNYELIPYHKFYNGTF